MRDDQTVKTFVTFRIAGDQLVPDEITGVLNIVPTHAHEKGENYSTGKSTIVATAGVWLFRTDRITACEDFYTHVSTALF